MSKAATNPFQSPTGGDGPGALGTMSRIVGIILAVPLIAIIYLFARFSPLTLIVWHAALCLLGCRIAKLRGYSLWIGLPVGILIPVVGWLVLLLLPRTAAAKEQRHLEMATQRELAAAKQTLLCPSCGRENSIATRVCPRCDLRLAVPA